MKYVVYNNQFNVEQIPSTDNRNIVITSPPYNMNLRIRKGQYIKRSDEGDKAMCAKYTEFRDDLWIDDFFELHKGIINDLLEVSDMIFYVIQIVTGSKRAFFKLIGEFSEYIKEIIVWDKLRAEPAINHSVLNSQSEFIIVFDKNNAISRQYDICNFDRGTETNIWKIGKERSTHKNNRAVFPQELVRRIINNFCVETDTIIDPFCGTGTTGVIAAEYNIPFIGFDIDPELCKHSLNRILETHEFYYGGDNVEKN